MNTAPLKITSFVFLGLLIGCVGHGGHSHVKYRISYLIDQAVTSKSAQKKSFDELVSLGGNAIPYLVSNLGDSRILPFSGITLPNRAQDAFESHRRYSPETMHDALAAILNHMTGQSFVFVYNGATSREREYNLAKWVQWCQSEYKAQAEDCVKK